MFKIQYIILLILSLLILIGEGSKVKDNEVNNYNSSQLWRIEYEENRKSDADFLINLLEQKFDGIIWKQRLNSIDVSFEVDKLKSVDNFLKSWNLSHEILIKNVDELIDEESFNHNIMRRSVGKVPAEMNWKQYQNLEIINQFMSNMAKRYPNLVTIINIGKSYENRPLNVLKISSKKFENYDPKEIWIDGGTHAREWISPASVTYVVNSLLQNWNSYSTAITNKTWLIMPMVNPDGYAFSRINKNNRMWRKNRSKTSNSCYGVDLNRNFATGWGGKGSSKNPCSDIYCGDRPFSEPESQAVRKFLESRANNLKAYLTFHSYGQVMGYPWGYKAELVEDYKQLEKVGNQAVKKIKAQGGVQYQVIPSHLIGIASGSDDWSRSALNVDYVYTMELRDKGKYGFLLPAAEIVPTAKEALIFVETIAENI